MTLEQILPVLFVELGHHWLFGPWKQVWPQNVEENIIITVMQLSPKTLLYYRLNEFSENVKFERYASNLRKYRLE